MLPMPLYLLAAGFTRDAAQRTLILLAGVGLVLALRRRWAG